MTPPTNQEVLSLLDRLDGACADDLEGDHLDFKPWTDGKLCMKIAVEYAVCLANADGGVVVFGVSDNVVGRSSAIHGVRGYDLDVWRRGIFDSTRPNIAVSVEELSVPEGTGKLLIVRVPKGDAAPYGTSDGLFKRRVGKNCMPMDPASVARARVSTGAVDWSGETAVGVSIDDLDPVEIARARSILQATSPESGLLRLDEAAFLRGLDAVRDDRVTHTGLLLFGKAHVIAERCPQAQVRYAHVLSETRVVRNDVWRVGLLQVLAHVEDIFSGPANPEEELSIGLFKLRIPAFPVDVVREAVLNAVTHRDYSDPGDVFLRHSPRELVVTSPGGFVAGITPKNILRHGPASRNRTLADAFGKLRLVERAGTGLPRIFIPMLSYGKRIPEFETDGARVTLRIFDGSFDERMAKLVAGWRGSGRDVGLDGLLVLTYLREHAFIDSHAAAELLQLPRDVARRALDQLSHPKVGILERRGQTRAATYHLTKAVATDLLGKAAYTTGKGIAPARYAELVRNFVRDHGSITNQECRELLGLGDSRAAQVEASKLLRRWSDPEGFLARVGGGRSASYRLREDS